MIQNNQIANAYLQEWPKPTTLTAPDEEIYIASRHATFSATLKDRLAVSYKTEHTFSI